MTPAPPPGEQATTRLGGGGSLPPAATPRVRPLGALRSAFANRMLPPGSWLYNAGGMASLALRVGAELVTPGLSWRQEFLRQFIFSLRVTLGPASIVAFVIGFSTIGIQGGSLASAFGAIDRISAIAPVAFLRELGPALTTAIVAGTLGSTITAELGARKIRQELEALEVLGINPVRNLVLPRVIALGVMMPVLNLLTFWAGVVGTFAAAVFLYGATPAAFFDNLLIATSYIDLWSAVFKVVLFGLIIGVISAFKGLQVGGGAEGVGRAVNESVVTCLLAIFAISVLYTALFLALYPEATIGI
jgi:phospholipid/cholesterol/gamma-HCH transport system permease protein